MFIKSFFFDKEVQVDGDPELLDDSEFYQQLLKEFFETIDPTSSGIFFFFICGSF
jgi:protein AATF/BFR2